MVTSFTETATDVVFHLSTFRCYCWWDKEPSYVTPKCAMNINKEDCLYWYGQSLSSMFDNSYIQSVCVTVTLYRFIKTNIKQSKYALQYNVCEALLLWIKDFSCLGPFETNVFETNKTLHTHTSAHSDLTIFKTVFIPYTNTTTFEPQSCLKAENVWQRQEKQVTREHNKNAKNELKMNQTT